MCFVCFHSANFHYYKYGLTYQLSDPEQALKQKK